MGLFSLDFWKGIGREGKKVFLDPVVSTGEIVVRKPFAFAKWFFYEGPRPFGPEPEAKTLAERARAAQTPEEARAVLDELIGDLSRQDQIFLTALRTRGALERAVFGLPEEGIPTYEPFSRNVNPLIATGAAGEQTRLIKPYTLADKVIDEALRNDRNILLYLRETDPLSAMPFIFEQDPDRRSGGGSWWDVLAGAAGEAISFPKKVIGAAFTWPEKIEELWGWSYYNDVPDAYVRLSMAKRFYDLKLNFDSVQDFFALRDEQEARKFIDELNARGVTGEEAAKELEQFFDKNLGFGSLLGDLFGKILYDPLWFVPFGKIAEVTTRPAKAFLGIERLSRLTRLFATGGETFGYGMRGLLQLDEATYAFHKLTTPPRGIVRSLLRTMSTRGPWHLSSEATRQLLVRIAPHRNALFNIKTSDMLIDLQNTFAEGKAVGWVAEKIPDILDNPALAELSALVRNREWLTETVGKVIDHLDRFDAKLAEVPAERLQKAAQVLGIQAEEVPGFLRTRLVMHHVNARIQSLAEEMMSRALRRDPIGKFVVRSRPVSNTLRQAAAIMILNNPGFVYLNLVSNYARFLWHAALHPLDATTTYVRALASEVGGKWPERWTRMVKAFGLEPMDVELSAVRNTGFHDIFGRREAVETLDRLTPDDMIDLLTREFSTPAKDIVSRKKSIFRFLKINGPFFAWPLQAAYAVDKAARRASFIMALKEQASAGLAPRWVADSFLPDLTGRLVRAGIDEGQAQRLQGAILDRIRRAMMGDIEFKQGEAMEDFIRRTVSELAEEFGIAKADTVWSPTELAYRWVKEKKGIDGEAARYTVIQTLDNAINQVNDIVSRIEKDWDFSEVEALLDDVVAQHYDLNSTLSELARLPKFTPSQSLDYQLTLGLDIDTIKREWGESLTTLDRHLRSVIPGGDESLRSLSIRIGDETIPAARAWYEAGRRFTVQQYDLLAETNKRVNEVRRAARTPQPGLLQAADEPLDAKSFSLRARDFLNVKLDDILPSVARDKNLASARREQRLLLLAAHDAAIKGQRVTRDTFKSLVGAEFGKNVSDADRALLRRARQEIIYSDARPHADFPPRERVRLVHYGPSDLDEITADFFKADMGIKDRVADQPFQSHFYPFGAKPESAVTAGKTRYVVETNAALADLEAYMKTHKIKDAETAVRRLVADGYDGFRWRQRSTGKEIVSLFYDVVPRSDTLRIGKQQVPFAKGVVDTVKKQGRGTFSVAGRVVKVGTKDPAAYETAVARIGVLDSVDDLSEKAIERAVKDHIDLLSRPNHYLSVRVADDGKVYLDVSTILNNEREAFLLAGRRGERQVFKLNGKGQRLDVPDDFLSPDETIEGLWQRYFAERDRALEDVYNTARSILRALGKGERSAAVKKLDRWFEETKKLYREHIQLKNAMLQKIRSGVKVDDSIVQEYGGRIRQLFANYQRQRRSLFGFNEADFELPRVVDNSAPLAEDVEDFVQFVKQDIRENWAAFKEGEIAKQRATANVAQVLQEAGDEMANNWSVFRNQLVAQAMAKTDMVMLNYNNQYGLDYLINSFVPFSFWPTRDAALWSLRLARAPGAAGTLAQFVLFEKELTKKYNLPERFRYRIPIYLPGADEFFKQLPIVGDSMQSGDWGDWYFIDPLRFVFPYQQFVVDFDDERRRNTPMGRVLDFFESLPVPLNWHPFMTIVGRETGLLDRDAWQAVYFSGGPFGIPTTEMARKASRWFYLGDENAIPEEEQRLFEDKGHFSSNLLMRIFGVEEDFWDTYRAERAVWALAARDQLVPGGTHEENVRAAWEAIDTHKGPAWKRALKEAASEDTLRKLTRWAGFPFGDIQAMPRGEQMYLELRQAYSEAARRGELDKFFEKYPEFSVRSAVVRGITDPEEKEKAVDTELYYQDLDRIVNQPFQAQIDRIQSELRRLRSMPQTENVRESIAVLEAELDDIKQQQDERRKLLDLAYPNREKELSKFRMPRERALARLRSQYFSIDGDTFEERQRRQAEFLMSLPSSDEGLTEKDWAEVNREFFRIRITYGRLIDEAIEKRDFDTADRLRDERDALLEKLHEDVEKGVTREEFMGFLLMNRRPRTPEEQEFESAEALFDLWMSMVGEGSTLSRREKAAVSEYFRNHPLIQKHYRSSTLDLANLTTEQKLLLMRRREIWRQFYSLSQNPALQVDFMNSVKEELDFINRALGLPPTVIVDYRRPVSDLLINDPVAEKAMMRLALLRRQMLEESGEGLTPEQLARMEEMLANDVNDPSPFTMDDINAIVEPWAVTEAP